MTAITYATLIDAAMSRLQEQSTTADDYPGLCSAIDSAVEDLETTEPRGAVGEIMLATMADTLKLLMWSYGKRCRGAHHHHYLAPPPGKPGWKRERMRILQAMKRDLRERPWL